MEVVGLEPVINIGKGFVHARRLDRKRVIKYEIQLKVYTILQAFLIPGMS